MPEGSFLVPAMPGRTVEARSAPFNLLEAAIELGRWERTLCPPDKMYGPHFCLFDDGPNWTAVHYSRGYEEVVWTCGGTDPHAVMGEFRRHLRECAT